MIIEIKAPTPGESITEVEITNWLVTDGDYVNKNQDLCEIESDKATLTVAAPDSGRIKIIQTQGETIAVGKVIASIDSEAQAPLVVETPKQALGSSLEPAQSDHSSSSLSESVASTGASDNNFSQVKVTPLAQKLMRESNISIEDVLNGLRRISTVDVHQATEALTHNKDVRRSVSREQNRQKMSQLRKKLSQRLVAVKNETAMLTTFNEVDMSSIQSLREKYQTEFVACHGVKLGMMSFFIKAAALALKMRPMVNSMIDGDEIVTPDYADISVAVQAPKGLMVPVIRNAETLSLAQIELALKELASKAKDGKLSLEEMSGGTFTITNGGVFGSMLSTPLINPPQSAILGMHNIIDRPVAVNGRVEVRPMMYIALSYDHRIIDGKDSVGFLIDLKKIIENPSLLLVEGKDLNRSLLDLD